MDINKAPIVTLAELFGDDHNICIPGLQRNYCWGTGLPLRPAEKVTGFLNGLLRLYQRGSEVTLGLIYGYTEPQNPERIVVIDGQQRLTTLYLIAGMLYRRVPIEELEQILIDENMRIRLVYDERRETTFFLNDFVKEFFVCRDGRLSQLERSDWYFRAYDSDPTVAAMVSAVRIIDNVLESANSESIVNGTSGFDFEDFARFFCHALRFVYVDLGDAQTGSYTYIVQNTTGEPLTAARHISAMVATLPNVTEDTIVSWKSAENWFWLHRDKRDSKYDSTSDAGLENFIAVWMKYRGKEAKELAEPGALDDLLQVFDIYRHLNESLKEEGFPPSYDDVTPASLFGILPLIAYCERFGIEEKTGERRMWMYLRNITRYTRITPDMPQIAVDTIKRMPDSDMLSLMRIRVTQVMLPDEERAKLDFLSLNLDRREEIEAIIERGQRHPMLNGRLQQVLDWSTDRTELVNPDRLAFYIDGFYRLWGEDIDCNTDLDSLRRALLTCRHYGYPLVRRGETVLSLCWQDYDWQRLMTLFPGVVRQIIERTALVTPEVLIDRFADKEYPYYFLIKQPNVMLGCHRRQLLRPCEVFIGVHDSAKGTVRWYVEQRRINMPSDRWRPMRAYGSRCLYTDHREMNIAVDLYYTPDQRSRYRLELFSRPEDEAAGRIDVDIERIISECGLPMRYDAKRKRHVMYLKTASEVINALKRVAESV